MKLYMHGNCQAWALDQMAREIRPDWRIDHRQVHLFDIDDPAEKAAYRAIVAQADVILAQPISANYRDVDYLSLDYLRGHAAPNCRILTFPSIYFRGVAIQSYDLNLPGFLADYHDVHIADMYRRGIGAAECAAEIASLDFLPDGLALQEAWSSLAELAEREISADLDIRISDLICARMGREILFHTFNHPARRVLSTVLNRMLSAIGEGGDASAEGISYLANTRIQPYPSAALQLGLGNEAVPELGSNTIVHDMRPMAEYVTLAYRSYDQFGRERVAEAIGSHAGAAAYLRRFEDMRRRRGDGRAEARFVDRIYRAMLDRPAALAEIRYWMERDVQRDPTEILRAMLESDELRGRLRRG